MNISSAKVDATILSQSQSEFNRATGRFQSIENIFNNINSEYLSSEESFLTQQFEERLAEVAYNSTQDELSRLRLKQKGINNTDTLNSYKISKHESIIQNDSGIIEIEGKIAENQAEITKTQQELNTLKAKPGVIRYKKLSTELTGLQAKESGLVELIAIKEKNGEDVSYYEQKLASVRKEIQEKQKEMAELQPEYDEMQAAEAKLENLLKENNELVKKRLDIDPQLVKYNKINDFFSTVVHGDDNGLGINSRISDYKDDLSQKEETYETKTSKTSSLQELLNQNNSIKSSIKSDLEASKTIRAEKQRLLNSIS